MAGCYIAGRSSGAHLNPATAIILDVFRGFPKNEILVCIVGQLIGAYVNSIVAYRDYLKGMLGLLNDDSDRMSEVCYLFVTDYVDGMVYFASGFVWTLPSNPLINIDTERFFASTGLALENLGLDGYDIIGDKWYCCAPTTGVIVGGTRDDFSILL
ncbi:hypothetical protein E4T38_02816 [Aureobasidium subglaciale]|nr:hypothetical protein E4T38_02816 [Aureobasidium subglaciale]KAI5227296.1 hypothetical protein E4T40_02744 [Aureobasidium subglaciale]KAI5230612.1 hypothetical protein E4T41_02815 [Aureobasidium subglaciale]KAI5264859.1 hypothetical protein E4T46_02593 [Aureobasidium subglaciale]